MSDRITVGAMHKHLLIDLLLNYEMELLSRMGINEPRIKDLPSQEMTRKSLGAAMAQMKKEGYRVEIKGDMVIFHDTDGPDLLTRKMADGAIISETDIAAAAEPRDEATGLGEIRV